MLHFGFVFPTASLPPPTSHLAEPFGINFAYIYIIAIMGKLCALSIFSIKIRNCIKMVIPEVWHRTMNVIIISTNI